MQAIEQVDSLSLTLYSTNGVTLDLNCDEIIEPTNVTRFQIATLQPDEQFFTAFSVCMDNYVEYQLLLEYTSFSPVEWQLDSVSQRQFYNKIPLTCFWQLGTSAA